MASGIEFVTFVADQLREAGTVEEVEKFLLMVDKVNREGKKVAEQRPIS